MSNVTLSPAFRASVAAVNTAHAGLGGAVADMLALGYTEYAAFDQFREAVKSGLDGAAWATVTNYMSPMRRAWENLKVAEFCETAKASGIKAALKMFPAGKGKRGFKEAAPVADTAPVIKDVTGDAIATATAKADAMMAEQAASMEIESLKADNAALAAQVASLKADNAALAAQVASLKAKAPKPAKLAAAAA